MFYKYTIKAYSIINTKKTIDKEKWLKWSKFTNEVGYKLQMIGDDLTITKPVNNRKT